MKSILTKTSRIDRELIFLPIVIFLLGTVSSLINPNFLTVNNMLTILQQVSVLGILSMAMLMLLISGMLDLSYGYLTGLCGVALCQFITMGLHPYISLFLMFLIALSGGLLNGLIVTRFNCEPLIITIGTGFIFYGLGQVWSEGTFQSLQGELAFIGTARVGSIPVTGIVLVIVLIIIHIVLKYTPYGRKLHLIGGNREVAFLSGINTKKYIVINFVIGGLICGLSAFVLASRIGSALATNGNGNELRALAACIIGGATFAGAKGSVIGTLLGVLLLGVISNALNIIGINAFYQNVVLGFLIVLAVVVSNYKKND